MDENYLDNLLNEISLDKEIDHNVEDELDNQIQSEKEKRQDTSNLSKDDLFDLGLNEDAGNTNLDDEDSFSEDQMDELDKLDDMADLDMGDLDFSDIDFDDLDVTKLDELPDDADLDDLLKEFDGNFEIEDHFEQDSTDSTEKEAKQEDIVESSKELDSDKKDGVEKPDQQTFDADQFLDGLLLDEEQEAAQKNPLEEVNMEQEDVSQTEETKEESATSNDEAYDLDDLLEDMGEETRSSEEEITDIPEEDKQPENIKGQPAEEEVKASDGDDLEDLFSLLDLDENESQEHNEDESSENEIPMQDNPVDDLDVVGLQEPDDEVSKKEKPVKKKSLMTILFGEPDEDDELSPEELEAIEQKKAEKKAKKEAARLAKEEKKAAAKEEKAAKTGDKKKAQEEKKKVRAVKKAKQKEEEEKNAEPVKPLNKPAVVFIFTLFLGGTFLFYLGMNNFNYTLAIQKATDYFDNQKYHKAYDEIKGVEVKEKDQDLKDRIYTVMYVERLYEAYQNNIELDRQKKALDSLLRGVDKYYEYYDEAQKLGIVDDLNYSFAQVQTALQDHYGITVEQAAAINQLDSYEYVQTVDQYVQDGKW
ncbi:putative uncharacterized protein [Clostridium sp. CAG:590]|nr:putative uncharacterized protein [Clostridium sp. CAG:590]